MKLHLRISYENTGQMFDTADSFSVPMYIAHIAGRNLGQ